MWVQAHVRDTFLCLSFLCSVSRVLTVTFRLLRAERGEEWHGKRGSNKGEPTEGTSFTFGCLSSWLIGVRWSSRPWGSGWLRFPVFVRVISLFYWQTKFVICWVLQLSQSFSRFSILVSWPKHMCLSGFHTEALCILHMWEVWFYWDCLLPILILVWETSHIYG